FPDLSVDRSISYLKNTDLNKALKNFQADLTFSKETSGDTQLVLIKVKGKELAQILDEDFNRAEDYNWFPSPYKMNKEKLEIKIGSENFELEREYKILTDLESIQKDHRLIQEIASMKSESLANHSWISFEEDSVTSSLSAQRR